MSPTNPPVRAAVYARVSSDQQAQDHTIASQIEALQERLRGDGMVLDPELSFIDDGWSGATLVRPALDRLRDLAALGLIERLYVFAPDRLSRRHAYQVLLLEELRLDGVEVIFLDHVPRDTAEDRLLLEVQGIVAEYERAQIAGVVAGAVHAALRAVNILGRRCICSGAGVRRTGGV
jgi:site-specific DNA recombinase